MTHPFQQLFRTPQLYETTGFAFWEDPYISKQMLKAHLAPNQDGATRSHDFVAESARWIRNICPPQKYTTLLDHGCGPGIYAEKFHEAGYQVTGIDLSSRSIRYAKEQAEKNNLRIHYLCGNYLHLDYKNAFDLITFIYCDYGALSDQDRKTVLKNIYCALKTEGKLILDVFSQNTYTTTEIFKTWEYIDAKGFWSEIPHLLLSQKVKYENNVLSDQYYVITKNKIKNYYLWNTCFSKTKLGQELSEAGFKNIEFYADVKGTAYNNTSPTIAVCAEK